MRGAIVQDGCKSCNRELTGRLLKVQPGLETCRSFRDRFFLRLNRERVDRQNCRLDRSEAPHLPVSLGQFCLKHTSRTEHRARERLDAPWSSRSSKIDPERL